MGHHYPFLVQHWDFLKMAQGNCSLKSGKRLQQKNKEPAIVKIWPLR